MNWDEFGCCAERSRDIKILLNEAKYEMMLAWTRIGLMGVESTEFLDLTWKNCQDLLTN